MVEISEVGLTRLACDPAFGGVAMTPDTVIPTAVRAVLAPCSGYVQLLDVDGFQRCLAGAGAMYILRGPGKHVLEGQPLAQVSGDVSPEVLEELARKFLIGDRRSFEQDPVFGLHVMSEIGSKALSPGVNDAGTAIETIAGIQELLWGYAQARAVCDVRHPQVFVPVPLTQTLFEAAFGAIARDGAGQIEVALKLRKALKNLAMSEDAGTARSAHEMAALALSYGNAALPLEAEKARLREIVL